MKKPRRKRRELSKLYNAKELKALCLQAFRQVPSKTLNYKQIASRLNINDSNQRQLINNVLLQLKDKQKIEEVSRGKFRLVHSGTFITGVVEQTSKGYAFIRAN